MNQETREMRPKIYIIGVNHTSEKDGKRILKYAEELRPNAIFIERAEKLFKVGIRKLALVILKNPAFLLSYSIYSLIFRIWTKGKSPDLLYTKMASEKLRISHHQIDDNVYEMTVSRHVGWTPISWAVMALFLMGIVSTIRFIPFSLTFYMSLFWLFVFLFIFFALFVYFGAPTRNRHMKTRMDSVMKSNAFEKVFLVTGKRHVRDFMERLSLQGVYDVEDLTGR